MAEPYTTSTVTTGPSSFLQPFSQYGIEEAQRLYQTQTPEFYPGQTYAGFAPEQEMALQAQRQRALTGSPLVSGAQQFTEQALAGGFESAALPYAQQLAGGVDYSEPLGMMRETAMGGFLGGSPGLEAAIGRALDPVQARVQSTLSRAGRTGSGAAADVMSRTLGDVAADISYQDYATERANQLAAQRNLANLMGTQYESQLRGAGFLGDVSGVGFGRQAAAAQRAPAMAELDYRDIGRLQDVGATRQAMSQQAIDEAVRRYQFEQGAPYEALRQYQESLRGFPTGTTTTTQTPYYDASDASKFLGGALATQGAFDNPYVAILGGLLGMN